jgi:formate C-acetyltransferase
MEVYMVSTVVSESTLEKLVEHTRDLQFGKVRKTTFYPLVAESFKQTEGLESELRRALAFKHLLSSVEKVALPYEKIGGSIIGMWPEVEQPPYEEQYNQAKQYIQDMVDGKVQAQAGGMGFMFGRFAMMARDHYDSNCEFLRMQTIIKHLQNEFHGQLKDHVIAKALEDFFVFKYESDRGVGFGYSFSGESWYAANHMDLAYDRVVEKGWGQIQREAAALAKEHPENTFYKACEITLETVISFIKDYAAVYLQSGETNPDHLRIGKALEWVATEKPRGFFEAVQLTWITHIIANMQLGSALSFGRFDQYINPFYQMDKGSISEEEAVELVANVLIKVNEPKMRTVQSIIIGGYKRNGEPGYNDVTRLVLKASQKAHFPYPNVSFRVTKNIPQDLVDLAIETIKCGHGMPMLVNDEVWVPNFIRIGHTPEDARDYYNMGCVEMLINHASTGWGMVMGAGIDYPGILKRTMEGREFESFDALFNAYLDTIRGNVRDLKSKELMRFPGYDAFGSILIDGCLESGKDMLHGGTRLGYHIAVGGSGLGTAVDSLAAIRNVVYETKQYSLTDYLAIVAKNFEGHETLRQSILSRSPHYGNGGDVDELARTMFNTMTKEVYDLNDGGRDKWVTSYFSYTGATSQGELTPATPDGRLDGEPISDGLGPCQGRDVSGPTKLMDSLLKLDYRYLTGALATNIKVNPSLFSTRGGTKALSDLLLTYLEEGGPQVQVNFVRKEDLEDAKLHPHKHRDLVVRVAGFCATFIELDDKLQNEVISRTEHGE